MDLGDRSRVTSSLASLIHFWISCRGCGGWETCCLRVTVRLHWIVLKGYDLGQELLVEQSHPLLLLEDVLTVESHLFSFVV